METIFDRIRNLRLEQGMNQQQLAEKVGYKTASAVNKIELGLRDISQSKVILFAKALNTTVSYLVDGDIDNQEPTEQFASIGLVAAGYGHEAVEEWADEYCSVPAEIIKGYSKEDFMLLTVSGNSMYPDYQDGDRILVLYQATCNNGRVAVVMYGDNNATLKKVCFKGNAVILKPINPDYDEVMIKGSQLYSFRILGVPKYLMRAL